VPFMRMKHIVVLLAVAGRMMPAQLPTVRPLGTFDLHLRPRAGSRGSITFFVARNSHLYFVVSGRNSASEIQTDDYGKVQGIGSLGAAPIAGFDVDGHGNSFVLSGGSSLSQFDGARGN